MVPWQLIGQLANNANKMTNSMVRNSMTKNSTDSGMDIGGFAHQVADKIGLNANKDNVKNDGKKDPDTANQTGQTDPSVNSTAGDVSTGNTTAANGAVVTDGNIGSMAEGGYVDSDERIKVPTPPKDLLAEVAESINNYTYHYKPGIGEDPSIEHTGPMAQELLQVDGYRAAVFEDPETGLLEVDTNRLAMVNTGMIADLSKRLLLLEEFIKTVMMGPPQMAQEQSGAPAQGQPEMPDVE